MLSRSPQPTALWLSSFTLLALSASALPAQNEPPPAAAAAESVQLAFKHTVGQSQKFRGGGKADFTISLGEGGGLGPIPLGSKLDFIYTQKVAGTRTGTGTLSFAVDTFTMGVNALGTELTLKAQNGKVTTLMNGAPPPPGLAAGGGGGVQSMLGGGQLASAITLKRDPRGNITIDPAKSKNQMLMGVLPTYLQFPEKPVAVGETWETVLKTQPTVGGGPSGITIPEIELASTHTLKAIEVKNGRRHAIISTTSTSALAPAPAAPAAPAAPGAPPADAAGAPPAVQVETTATTRFDIDRGTIVSGQVKSLNTFNMGQIQIPAGAAGALGGAAGAPGGAPAGAPGMRIDGEVAFDFSEVAETAKKPTTKSKAKPKAKPRKR